jgi:pseudouridine kinase
MPTGSAGRAEVVVIGAACLDVKGRLPGAALAGTSNAGAVRISAGGCARNIAENLARLGVATALLSVASGDDLGTSIVRHTERAGVDMDHVLIDPAQRAAAYIALLGDHGQLLLGVDDTVAVEAITPAYITAHRRLLQGARMVVIDANVPLLAGRTVLEVCAAADVPVALDPVAYGPALRYRDAIGQFALVVPNLVEAEVLSGVTITNVDQGIRAARALVNRGVRIAIITMSATGVVYATASASGHVPALQVEIVDPTGAGDALTAAVVYALINELPLDEAVRLGVSAATLTLDAAETVRQDLSLESLYAQLVI